MGVSAPIKERQKVRLEKRLGRRFSFVSVLGQGAAGTVYEVMNLHLQRKEALKVLADTQPEDFSTRFSHEAKVSAALDHPNIVKIYEFEQERGSFWYSMQFIDGPSLAQIMTIRKDLDEVAMARLAIPLLDALHYSHIHGIIHRDIKPGNILINEQGRPFLTDFGIAKTTDNLVKTRTGTMLGTPAYVAPEQAMGQPVDHRADIYSLGVTLYEMLAKRLPFTAENSLQTVVMRIQEDPEPLLKHCPSMHAAFTDIIMRALVREKLGRWESAMDMKTALIQACEELGISWDQPMMAPIELARLRKTMSLEESTIVDLGGEGPWQMVYDPPAIVRFLRRIHWPWLAGSAACIVVAFAGVLWWRHARAAVPVPPPPSVSTAPAPPPIAIPTPAPSAPPIIPAVKTPPQAVPAPPKTPEAIPRRAVTPPMLQESSQPELNGAQCAGLTVNLSLHIGEDGHVKSCKVLSKVPPECAKAAQDAGLRYRFQPALDAQGQPVESVVAIAIILAGAP